MLWQSQWRRRPGRGNSDPRHERDSNPGHDISQIDLKIECRAGRVLENKDGGELAVVAVAAAT